MGCIEIAYKFLQYLLCYLINFNMGCVEMFAVCRHISKGRLINFNMGCIETIQKLVKYSTLT